MILLTLINKENKMNTNELKKNGLVEPTGKIPLIVATLLEAKKQGLKWVFMCERQIFHPACEENDNYKDWADVVFTDDIKASFGEYLATDMMNIAFDTGSWIYWINCNPEDMDKLADYTTDLEGWLRPVYERYDS